MAGVVLVSLASTCVGRIAFYSLENQNVDELEDILTNWTVTELIHRPVSKQVNNARNNEASNIQPLKQMEIKF